MSRQQSAVDRWRAADVKAAEIVAEAIARARARAGVSSNEDTEPLSSNEDTSAL